MIAHRVSVCSESDIGNVQAVLLVSGKGCSIG
jgi:hypothetical protein